MSEPSKAFTFTLPKKKRSKLSPMRSTEKMCEWLSTGDWCDVQLFCDGRSFNAHRAVLATASSFLRRILVSCPVDETPICIFLPDFDLEAFSSVLYYVYNGEVVIQKQKLRYFLDVVKALEIFIDLQGLQKRYVLEDDDLHINKDMLENTYTNKTNKVLALDSASKSDQQYINIKKGEHIRDVHSELLPDDSDFRDKQSLFKNWTDIHPTLQNLPTFYFDRQKNFFLRDLCLETYPRNGNTNGLTASVLAISNEAYRPPASVSLTNVNGKHPRDDDIFSDITRKTTDHASHVGCNENNYSSYHKDNGTKIFSDAHLKNIDSVSTVFSEEEAKDTWTNIPPFHPQSPLLQLNMSEQLLPEMPLSSLDFNTTQGFADPLQSASTTTTQIPEYNSLIENITQHHANHKISLESNHNYTKPSASIYNQVLENPWCPRLPFNYRPTNKRNPCFIIDEKEVEEGLINDTNNNIQPSELPSTEKIPEKILTGEQDFKCAICSQVFANSENLVEHARQHSAPGRYTCCECGKSFSQLRNFKYHMSVHRGTREFAATCTVCGKYFNDRGYLSSHMKIHRNRKEYKCSMCPKSFNQRVAYNMHVRIHTGVKPHVCEQCGKAFSRKMLLKQHQRTHSGERPYACPHCDKRFADRSNMTLHLRLHSGVKPFSCSLCPKSFTKKHHLKSHLNFHTGAKPYSCPRCNLSFTQSSNMRTHFKKCNAQEPVADST